MTESADTLHAPLGARPTQPTATGGRVPELDLLRFIAAVSVVMYHYAYRPSYRGVVDESAFGGLQHTAQFGYLGVNLFFMISGFVILWSSQARGAGEFVISRIARLFPSFWVCLSLTSIALAVAGASGAVSFRQLAFNTTMVPSLFGVDYVDGVYWTLFVELKFYLLVFVVLLTGTMHHAERWIGLWLIGSLAAAIGLAPHWAASLAMYPAGSYFISGCLLFLIRSRGFSVARGVGLALSCTLATMNAVAEQSGFIHRVTHQTSFIVASSLVAFHVVFLAVVLKPRNLPKSRWWAVIGSLTYPLYLLHNQIGKVVREQFGASTSLWLSLVGMLAVSFCLAAIVALTVERRGCRAFHDWLVRTATRLRVLRPTLIDAPERA